MLLVIKERDDAISKINEKLIKIWKSKYTSTLKINTKKGISEKKYYLNTSLDEFKINKVYITSFLEGLWAHPEAVYHILINSDNKIVKTNLASFIVNNFYCNYLSGNYMENNLLYIISLMLSDEIDQLDNINEVDNFLENTKCGFLLEELQKMPDIQIYFKNVIIKTVEKIERNSNLHEIKINVLERQRELIKLKEEEEKKTGKKIDKNLDEFYKDIIIGKIFDKGINHSKKENYKKIKELNDNFIKKYLYEISVKELNSNAEKAKEKNSNDLYEYYTKLENDLKANNDLYTLKGINNKIAQSDYPSNILAIYLNDFMEIISLLEQLMEDLMNNILLLPNSIKYICKIISILIKKKFPNISKTNENAFISRFLLDKLLIPIISLPSITALITDFVISGTTLKSIKTLNYVLNKLFSGKLFINKDTETDYMPFNRFFLNKMEEILLYFEKVINVKLPYFIDKFIYDELPEDYLYNYFNENEEQIYASISICFNIENICNLVKGLKNSDFFESKKDTIKKFKKALDKLSEKAIIEGIKNTDLTILNRVKEKYKKKDSNQSLDIENIFLFNCQSIEKKYQHLFLINNKIANFYIDIKREEKKRKLDEKEKNIIKIKNYLCNSLGNYRLINKSDFSIGSTSDTKKMLEEIKYYMSLPNFILNNNTIPSIWYINSILDYLNKIPEDYKKDDYKKLFEEITINLNDSINNLDFEILILFRNKLKFLDKMNNYFENIKQLINNISINDKIKQIVEEAIIPIDFLFQYNEKIKKFEIMKSNIKEKMFENKLSIEDTNKKLISFKTIEAFTKYFPNLAKYQLMQGLNPINIIKELSINIKLENYFEIIKEKIIKDQILGLDIYKSLYKEKIKDYIMDKIYEKIYPPEPDELDTKIFKKSNHLSWVEPNIILEEKDYYIFDSIMPDILNEFKRINISKTPYMKLNCMRKILEYTKNLIIFNEGEDKKPSQEDITPVLNYVFIKAHPYRIYTDIEFIKVFLSGSENNECNLANIESICSLILNTNNKTFHLTEEEYFKKCVDAANDCNINE